jgi:hypothetical protein
MSPAGTSQPGGFAFLGYGDPVARISCRHMERYSASAGPYSYERKRFFQEFLGLFFAVSHHLSYERRVAV